MSLEEQKRRLKLEANEGLLQSTILLIENSDNIEVLKLRISFERELKKLNEIILN